MSSAFAFTSAEHAARAFRGEEEAWIYGRWGNPTVDALEKKLAGVVPYLVKEGLVAEQRQGAPDAAGGAQDRAVLARVDDACAQRELLEPHPFAEVKQHGRRAPINLDNGSWAGH